MKSITKLPRALLNASLGRGRNRLSRMLVLAVLVGITYAIYHQLSQQTLKKVPGDGRILKVRGSSLLEYETKRGARYCLCGFCVHHVCVNFYCIVDCSVEICTCIHRIN